MDSLVIGTEYYQQKSLVNLRNKNKDIKFQINGQGLTFFVNFISEHALGSVKLLVNKPCSDTGKMSR